MSEPKFKPGDTVFLPRRACDCCEVELPLVGRIYEFLYDLSDADPPDPAYVVACEDPDEPGEVDNWLLAESQLAPAPSVPMPWETSD